MRIPLAILLFALCGFGGCSLLKSRYAMDDPVYAEKYAEGAPKTDPLGKTKQALDARHAGGLGGIYLSGGAQVRPDDSDTFVGGELGVESYATSWLTARGALATYVDTEEGYSGLDVGLRLQAPTRIAPFAGIGMFHGYSRRVKDAMFDGIDNNDDGWIDEPNETKTGVDGWLSAVYPEVGAHLWLNGSWRVTAYGRYLVTTEGREHDDWLVGGQVTVFNR